MAFGKFGVIVLILFAHLSPVATQGFTNTPSDPVYVTRGQSVTLDWQIPAGMAYMKITWSNLDDPDTPTLASLQVPQSGNPKANIHSDYEGRLEINEATITINDVALKDLGEIQCEVLLSNLSFFVDTTKLNVLVHPTVVTSEVQDEVEFTEGNQAQLVCVFEGVSAPQVSWSTNGVEVLNGQDRYSISQATQGTVKPNEIARVTSTLTISDVQRTDMSEYTCNATNGFQSKVHRTALIVLYPANISSLPLELATFEGATDVRLACLADGNPAPSIRWFKDGVLLSTSDEAYTLKNTQVKFTMESVLTLTTIRRVDFGVYTCEAQNTLATVNKNTSLLVNHDPRFISALLLTHTVERDGDIVLNCTVESYPISSVQWYTNVTSQNVTIEPVKTLVDTKETGIVEALLTIKRADLEVVGTYECRANNTKYDVAKSTQLRVSFEPEVETFPEASQAVKEFELNYLECSVLSYPESTILWFHMGEGSSKYSEVTDKSNTTTAEANNSPSQLLTTSRLVFPRKIARADAGVYYCSVVYQGNEVARKDANITVYFPPEFVEGSIEQDTTVEAELNHSINLSCIVQSKPLSTITWYKENVEITDVTMVNEQELDALTTSSVLVLSSVAKVDKGEYKCVAENFIQGTPHQQERIVTLQVVFEPTLQVNSSTVEVNLTEAVTLSCETKSYPPVHTYLWTKNGEDLQNNQSTFIIASVEKESAGNYSCTPINSVGSGSTITHWLHVKAEPTFVKQAECSQDFGVLRCLCAGEGYPPPTVYWTRTYGNGTEERLADSPLLEVNVSVEALGTYSCHLENENGVVSSNYVVDIFNIEVSSWGNWDQCNTTCGEGVHTRNRSCLFKTCTEPLNETQSCTADPCPVPIVADWHKDWYITFWVLIPLIIILLIICCCCVYRKKKNSGKAIVVPTIHKTVSNTHSSNRSLPTQRDIYLPDQNELGVVNTSYAPEKRPRPRYTNGDTDMQEVTIDFDEEDEVDYDPSDDNGNAFYRHYDQAGPAPDDIGPIPKKRRAAQPPAPGGPVDNRGYIEIEEGSEIYARLPNRNDDY